MSTTLDAGQTYIDIILPTFHTEPAELDRCGNRSISQSIDQSINHSTYITLERFYPSAAKEIADAILTEELSSQTYDEEEAKGWANRYTLVNISSYTIDQSITYQPTKHILSLLLSRSICDRVREAVKDKLCATRYKVVVQTTIGQLKDQAIRFVVHIRPRTQCNECFPLRDGSSQGRFQMSVGPHC